MQTITDRKSIIKQPPFTLALAQELLATYGSPLYVYQSDILRRTIARITKAIDYPRTQFCFASVTNGSIALLQIFRDSGWGLHANTPGDIYLGIQAGFAPKNIVYSGSNLHRDEMEQVLKWGVKTLNFDSLSQLQLCCEVYQSLRENQQALEPPSLGLRLNLPELTGESRIGVRSPEFPAAIAIAKTAGLKLSGLHFYRGTGTNSTAAFTQVIDTIIAAAQQLPDWEYLDFGGGFGYPYHSGGTAFDWELFGAELTSRISQLDRAIELIIEPGRAAVAGCATLLAQVVPSVHGGYREICTWNCRDALHFTDVCGNTTYSRDYLGKNCQLPALTIGEILGILDVGAYGYAMSSHFLHRPKPAEVLLENSQHRLIRQREDYSILLANQVF
ncbi:decarboxylase [Microcoleus sp. PH2017_18_LLB_O_A]|uniref:diaminopimelate decarboxylase family protein n=1 Tax=Microcoleus sp. PH2017_18_LLB_O_A TaxID=2798829 RepID=UPI001D733B81|nr:decarboxylase [Microcoleus sp. PH2017_18_LLB_O_A]MCC3516176.1 decarboxylase [Microcoleus sp. PH2017_18_LLB_O_A]